MFSTRKETQEVNGGIISREKGSNLHHSAETNSLNIEKEKKRVPKLSSTLDITFRESVILPDRLFFFFSPKDLPLYEQANQKL